MVAWAEEKRSLLLVNYIRRFEPGTRTLKTALENKEFGTIYKGIVWYTKGILNNGSHFVDLLRFWLGEVTKIQILNHNRKWEGKDPEPDLCLHFNDTLIYFLAAREEFYSHAQIELMGSRGKIIYGEGGAFIEVKEPKPDSSFPGYWVLSESPKRISNDFNRYQWHVVDHLYRSLIGSQAMISDGRSALATLRIIEKIIQECERGEYA